MTVELHPRVLELIASRICHDLVSPVGAINNGVELMEELGEDAGDEAVALIAGSAQQASYRLKCFRLAYGAAGSDGNISFKMIADAFTDWVKAGHIHAEFEENMGMKFSMPPKGFFKVLLNVLILAEECNRGEGKVIVSALEGNQGIKVVSHGKHAAFRDNAELALEGKIAAEDLDARTVHPYMTHKFAEYYGLKINQVSRVDSGEVEIQVHF
jgi:histidine phosphotransferase ChpT